MKPSGNTRDLPLGKPPIVKKLFCQLDILLCIARLTFDQNALSVDSMISKVIIHGNSLGDLFVRSLPPGHNTEKTGMRLQKPDGPVKTASKRACRLWPVHLSSEHNHDGIR